MSSQPNDDVNPYASPKSRVEPVIELGDEPPFFSVSLLKLALMCLATFGLYKLYWFYKNWKCVQRLNGRKISAPLRAFFYTLTSYSLFCHIRDQARAVGIETSLQAGLLAVGVFVFGVLWRLPDPLWLVSYFSFLPLLPVQSVVNQINRKSTPDADPNRRLQGWNIATLIIGGLLLVLTILGTFVGK